MLNQDGLIGGSLLTFEQQAALPKAKNAKTDTADYLEVYCRNLSTASNVTVKNLNFFAMNAN